MLERILIFTFLLLVSCTGQRAPELESRYRSVEEQRRAISCGKVSYLNDFLEKSNVMRFFECFGWDSEFDQIYKGIEKTAAENWNHIMMPVSRAFFENQETRNKVFSHLKTLDSKNALDDLSEVITALNDTNFYQGLHQLFVCAENPEDEGCENRGPPLTKSEIGKFIELMDVEEQTVDGVLALSANMVWALKKQEREFKESVQDFIFDRDFQLVRLAVMTALMDKFNDEGYLEQDYLFFKYLISKDLKGRTSETPYIYQWLNSDNLTFEIFRDAVRYNIVHHPSFSKDYSLIQKRIKSPLECRPEGSPMVISENLEDYSLTFVENISRMSHRQLMDFLLKENNILITAKEECPDLNLTNMEIQLMNPYEEGFPSETFIHSMKSHELVDALAGLMRDPFRHDIVKFITMVANNFLPERLDARLYLLDLFSGNISHTVFEGMKVIDNKSTRFTRFLYNFLRDIPLSSFPMIDRLMDVAYVERESLKYFHKNWRFLTFSEKNYLLLFVDKHFKQDINYIALFEFYLSSMEEFKKLLPYIRTRYLGSPENLDKTFYGLKDIAANFHGARNLNPNVLKQFKKFFGRDHVMKLVKILTRGIATQGEYASYLSGVEVMVGGETQRLPRFSLQFNQDDTQYAEKIYQCIGGMAEIDMTLYDGLRNLPDACSLLVNSSEGAHISMSIMDMLKQENRLYAVNNGLTTEEEDLFRRDGLLAPDMIHGLVSLVKEADKVLETDPAWREQNPSSLRIEYPFDSFAYHIFEQMGDGNSRITSPVFVDSLRYLMEPIFEANDEALVYRNSVMRSLFENNDENFNKLDEVIEAVGFLAEKYGESPDRYGSFHPLERDMSLSCDNTLVRDIGPHPCPDKQQTITTLNQTIGYLISKYEDNSPTALELMLRSLIPDVGLRIPYESDEQTYFKRLSLKETASLMYEMSDKTTGLKNEEGDNINRMEVPFILPDGDKVTRTLTSSERVEVVVREVRFDMNYLGAHYMNAVAKADDYNRVVEAKYKLMKTCVKIFRFCLKFFDRNQKNMAHNAVATYLSLLDMNRYFRYPDTGEGFGDYMKVLLQIVVASSSKVAQKSDVFKIGSFELPYIQTKRQLERHNGRILTELTQLATFTNGGRWLRDRIARGEDGSISKERFYEFLNSKEFLRLNNHLMRGFDVGATEDMMLELLTNMVTVRNRSGETALEKFVGWGYDLSYPELRLLENTLFKVGVISTYVGPPSRVFEGNIQNEDLEHRYRNNSLFNLLEGIKVISTRWPVMESVFMGAGRVLVKTLRPINTLVTILYDNLLQDENDGLLYKLLNESFLAVNKLLVKEHSGVVGEDTVRIRGIELVLNYLERNSTSNYRFYDSVSNIHSFVDELHRNRKDDMITTFFWLGKNLQNVAKVEEINMYFLKDYLKNTLIHSYNIDGEVVFNHRYDEPARVFRHLTIESTDDTFAGTGYRKMYTMLHTMFNEYYDQVKEVVRGVLPYISIRYVN